MSCLVVVIYLLCLSLSLCNAEGFTPMVIDHDGGADDAMAIFTALLNERLHHDPIVMAITTTHGNVNESQVYENSQKILSLAQERHKPIYRGSKSALVTSYPSDNYFGLDGLGDLENFTYEPNNASTADAVYSLIWYSQFYKGRLIIVALGPLTNIAMAIKLHPDFIDRVKHIYIGSGTIYSEKYDKPEFNAKMDIEAYHIVAQYATPDKVTVFPFSVFRDTFNISMDWRNNVLGKIPSKIMQAQNLFERISNKGQENWLLLDPIVMAMVLNNYVIEKTEYSNNSILLCGFDHRPRLQLVLQPSYPKSNKAFRYMCELLIGVALSVSPPKDRRHLVYWTLMLHGLGTLIGWNMFITAKDYFVEYKLADSIALSEQFLVYVGYASQTPNFIFNWVNVFIKIGGNLNTRILCSLMAEVAVFVVTIVLAMMDSSTWPVTFLWLTLMSVLLFNISNAIYQNSIYGVAAKLPPSYMGAVILGSNICGTLVVLLNWVTDVAGHSVRTAAIYYFIGGMFVQLICLDTYFALPLNKFYRYHTSHQQPSPQVTPAVAAKNQHNGSRTPYKLILKQTWVQLYNIFVTFFVTLAVFPAVHSDIQPVIPAGHLGENFTRITCFLTFNVMAMLGNITATIWQHPSRKYLSIFTTLRLVFVIFFLLCNYRPKGVTRTMRVLVNRDDIYWLGSFIFSWSHGHAGALCMMFVAGNVAPEHASKAGMLGAATLVTGILVGIMFSGQCHRFVSL